MYCTNCGKELAENSTVCDACGQEISKKSNQNDSTKQESNYFESASPNVNNTNEKRSETAIDKMTSKLNTLTGGTGAVKLHIGDLFKDVFKSHTKEERDEILIYGTSKTTPNVSQLNVNWPRPWIYSRIFFVFAVAFIILYGCYMIFKNDYSIPGIIFLGSFAVPISLMFMFYEMNVPRNISFFNVLKIFLVGGCGSLFITLIFYSIFDSDLGYITATIAGIVEEVGKLLLIFLFVKVEKKSNFLFNGLLIGATIGAGFAAFESAGYALNELLETLDFKEMIQLILLRAVLAPGGHIAWSAISGFAIVLAKGDEELSFKHLVSGKFWSIFWMPVALHTVWDMPIPFFSNFCLVQIIISVLSWIILLVFISSAFKQINKKAEEAQNANISSEEKELTSVASE